MRRWKMWTAAAMTAILCAAQAFPAMADEGEAEQGTSYFEYQWALKNTGNLQRVMTLYEDLGELPLPGAPRLLIKRHVTENSVAGMDINVEPAWDIYERGGERRNVTVALIDTGVDISHPDLKDAIWVNSDEIPGDGIDNDGNGYADDVNGWNFYSGSNQVFVGDEDNHGTHGAGTIAGAWDGRGITGIADSAYVKIMPLKALGSESGSGVSEGVKEAIRYAEANGADICNLSMGTVKFDQELQDLIKNSSMLFVISAGNGDASGVGYDIDQSPVYPASYPSDNIISVANLMFDGTLDVSSNYGAESVDIAAPGTYILSTIPGGYGFMSGTSMSAPMVTGAVALIYSCRTDMDLDDVREAILGSAVKLKSLNGAVASGGMLNVYGALTYGGPGFVPAPPKETQPGEPQPDETQSGKAQPGEPQSGEPQPGETQSGKAQSGETQPGETQHSEAQTGSTHENGSEAAGL